MKTYEFYPNCEEYDFILEQVVDEAGVQYCHGIDIPSKDDPEWRFWTLLEEHCISWNLTGESCTSWNLSDEEKECIKEQAIKHCLENGYTFNGEYFERFIDEVDCDNCFFSVKGECNRVGGCRYDN